MQFADIITEIESEIKASVVLPTALMDSTVSVSKGVFVFKNGAKAASKASKRKKPAQDRANNNIFADQLWYQSYSNLWHSLEERIRILNKDMFAAVLSNLIDFIGTSYKHTATAIPSAVLLTGINMPDHAAQFGALARKIKDDVSPHVAYLHSQNCSSLKHMVENLVHQFINENVDDEFSDESEEEKSAIKKSQCSLPLLRSWFEELYHKEFGKKRKNLVVILPDFEGFNEVVLQNFILIASSYINVLPFVLVFGVATSLTALHRALPYKVSSAVNIQVFNSQASTTYLNNVLEQIFLRECPFHLAGKVFTLFTDIFLFYDLSVTGFIQNIKYAMLEHYSSGNAKALCCSFADAKSILGRFSHDDCENTRRLLSFRKLVGSASFEERVKLLTDDEHFKGVLSASLWRIHEYLGTFNVFLRCLHVLVQDLPRSPLGKQVRELYNIATSSELTSTPEYKECLQLLGFQAKDELTTKLTKIKSILLQELKNVADCSEHVHAHFKAVSKFLSEFEEESDGTWEEEEDATESSLINIGDNMDRKQLKEKLLIMSKKSHKPMNRYERLRKILLQFFDDAFRKFLYAPSRNFFHEIFFFEDASIQSHIVGTHRAAIHTALNDPYFYLQCTCCEIPNDATIHGTMPDICIIYKLHLEYGKMINLFDWLQAFLCIVDPVPADADDEKREVDPKLQARFTQAVAELEFLGFIKSSKRKTDHVSRLTWGG